MITTEDDEEGEGEGIVLLDSPGIIPAGQLDQRGEIVDVCLHGCMCVSTHVCLYLCVFVFISC